ncbi:adenylyl-sulfate reductase [Lamprobacter modestohalophilus]|uniref:adenylyl-sulfate reductase n=1 Tax=Lamprobacter modestohalophilus TaxID=1064514 RepID=UPI002ADEF7BA|nr:adenylyl-sulfate reductase [Lamprobacter modestohalophilus]MEA1049946.1 adenylyl-sulfate reductase [Lamprobacter modestohalophilus]
MFTTNPFAEVTFIPTAIMQGYIILMVLLVAGGTVVDMVLKKNAKYFFENARKAKTQAKRSVSGSEKTSLAVQTLAKEVLTSGEFANPQRRLSHLFTMYGFILFVVTTAILIFGYPTPADQAPAILPLLWHLGALMLCFGGYWFWFRIRVDVSAEGYPWYRIVRADMFILSLLAMATFGLIWSILQAGGAGGLSTFFFVLFIAATTFLFGTVYWSKFAHMFFKPAAAYQKRVIKADGSRENLPEIPELTDPAVKEMYPDIPEYMGDKPPYMGLGINREAPSHY